MDQEGSVSEAESVSSLGLFHSEGRRSGSHRRRVGLERGIGGSGALLRILWCRRNYCRSKSVRLH